MSRNRDAVLALYREHMEAAASRAAEQDDADRRAEERLVEVINEAGFECEVTGCRKATVEIPETLVPNGRVIEALSLTFEIREADETEALLATWQEGFKRDGYPATPEGARRAVMDALIVKWASKGVLAEAVS